MLLPSSLPSADLDLEADDGDGDVLPPELSITRITDLLAQMRFREAPKRALFGVPFELAGGFVVGVRGCVAFCAIYCAFGVGLLVGRCADAEGRYGLVTEQKKGAYAYFVDTGERMEAVKSRTVYVDEVHFSSSPSPSFRSPILPPLPFFLYSYPRIPSDLPS